MGAECLKHPSQHLALSEVTSYDHAHAPASRCSEVEWKWNWVGTAVTRSEASLGRISSTSTMRLLWLRMAASTWEDGHGGREEVKTVRGYAYLGSTNTCKHQGPMSSWEEKGPVIADWVVDRACTGVMR